MVNNLTNKNAPMNAEEVSNVAWRACDTFRGTMDPSQYKDYVLVMLFIKYISDLWRDKREGYSKRYDGDTERIKRALARERFIVPPESEFRFLYERRDAANIGELINIGLEAIEESNKLKLENVFRNIDFNSEAALGETKERNYRLKHLLEDFATLDLRPAHLENQDVIGDTYEYLIYKFASDAGKKGGEFYTPPEVSQLLAELLDPKPGSRICDPACGSGSLLIRVGKKVGDRNVALFGQERNGQTWALCRMNMFLHEVDAARIEWGDTLLNPKLVEKDKLMKFDIVVANPPFSLDKWGAERAPADPFKRFTRGTPPKSKADYAFILHMIETAVETDGRVDVIVPHGVLFRGGQEGKIRQKLIEENLLEAVIGLPANLFFGTGIPAAILLFNKAKKTKDVMFIDASNEYEDGKRQNKLTTANIEKIVATFRAGKSVPKYAHRATPVELKENEFNLNIPRYVDTFVEEEEIDVAKLGAKIEKIETELAETRREMAKYLKELAL
ncbi:MAG TPA: type I restriction-modification system subunit M [Phycisphaerae bacterium]|nr:type I restriction-modification system subunit M [Phycisphaerae bacterium]